MENIEQRAKSFLKRKAAPKHTPWRPIWASANAGRALPYDPGPRWGGSQRGGGPPGPAGRGADPAPSRRGRARGAAGAGAALPPRGGGAADGASPSGPSAPLAAGARPHSAGRASPPGAPGGAWARSLHSPRRLREGGRRSMPPAGRFRRDWHAAEGGQAPAPPPLPAVAEAMLQGALRALPQPPGYRPQQPRSLPWAARLRPGRGYERRGPAPVPGAAAGKALPAPAGGSARRMRVHERCTERAQEAPPLRRLHLPGQQDLAARPRQRTPGQRLR